MPLLGIFSSVFYTLYLGGYGRCGQTSNPDYAVRGYFAIGVENVSKPMNLGNLMRSAHAFGACYIFTINAHYRIRQAYSDTSNTPEQIPYFPWDGVDDMHFPDGCQVVGIELLEQAVDLPSFHHPSRAAYVLGPERGSLSPQLTDRCDHIVRIPTAFCINVATAGAVVMYDRIKSLGRFAAPPVHFGGPKGKTGEILPAQAHGKPRNRSENR